MSHDTDYSCGVIPTRLVDGQRQFLLVQHLGGHWAFPKGHPEKDESPLETAARELREETGLTDVSLLEAPAFEECYTFRKRSGKRIEKTVTYYLGELPADGDSAVTIQEEEVQAYAWGDVEQTFARLTFDEGRRLLDEVLAYLDAEGAAAG